MRTALHIGGDDWIVTDGLREQRVSVAPGGGAEAALAAYAEVTDPSPERLAAMAMERRIEADRAAMERLIYGTVKPTAQMRLGIQLGLYGAGLPCELSPADAVVAAAGAGWVETLITDWRAWRDGKADDFALSDPPEGFAALAARF